MDLSPHVSLAEFVQTAHRGVDNSLPAELLDTARETAAMVERVRTFLGDVPIVITSGYRCLALNRAVGSARTSDHPKAMAVDFHAPDYGTPFEIASALADHVDELGIGQLIHEFGTWVHVSTRTPDDPVNRVITISSRGTLPGVVET